MKTPSEMGLGWRAGDTRGDFIERGADASWMYFSGLPLKIQNLKIK